MKGLLILLSCGSPGAPQSASLPPYRIEQVTFGPRHHFYGYQGHAGNSPFNASGTHLLLLETDFQDRYALGSDAAGVVLVDLASKAKTRLTESRAWNFQQGSMMYWNPLQADEFFFNDRDAGTDKIKTVLYNSRTGVRREFFYPSTPFGNSGVAQKGGRFLGINYGRLDRLRPITGYAGAYDWTAGVKHPANDGIWIVDVASGTPRLLLSFKQLRDRFVSEFPEIDSYELFINHTLWNRDDTRISASVRWITSQRALKGISFTFKPDTTDLIRFPRDWGHQDWESGTRVMSGKAVVYDVRTNATVETVDAGFFTMDGDLALARDLNWIASAETRNLSTTVSEGRVILYNRAAGAGLKLPWHPRGPYFWNWNGMSEHSPQGRNRIDVSPCWNRNATKVYFFMLAPDGTRQAFVVHLGASPPPSSGTIQAESMSLSGYEVESNAAASGGALIRIPPANPGGTASATHVFTGTNGTYDVRMWYFDENDGRAVLRLYVNGVRLDSWVADQDLGSDSVATVNRTRRTKAGVALRNGDVLRLEGVQEGSEWARFDSIDLIPSGFLRIDGVSTGKAYSLSTAQAGALAYIDRSYTVTAVSANLSGQRMIRTANDDKAVTATNHLRFTVTAPAFVYVCYSGTATSLPGWLSDGTWTSTSEALNTSDTGIPRKIYRKSVPAGQVILGGNRASPAGGPAGYSNYVVVVKPQS